MRLAVMVLAALVAICPNTQAAIQYVFKESEYTLEETGTADTTVQLIRTSNVASEITGETTVVISTDCPTECETMPGVYVAGEGDSADYTINDSDKIITFSTNPSVTDQAVSITVHNDAIEEKREYFCLSVVDPTVRGTQWSTRVIIPWNDHCVVHYSPSDRGTGAASTGYNIQTDTTVSYVGPWSHAIMPTLTIEVTPQHSDNNGDGNDINLFLATTPDQSGTVGTFEYYGIFLDNDNAMDVTFGQASQPASFVTDNSLTALVGSLGTNEQIIMDVTNTLQLQFSYSTSSVTVDIQRTEPSTSTALDETEMTNIYNIGHLFVSAADDKYANWKICGLVPRRLNAVGGGALASGHVSEFHAGRTIDGARDASGECFVSDADSDGKHWLRIDLGRVLYVKKVIIFPVVTVTGISDPMHMDSARVYVGSCNPTDALADISRMHVCDDDIGPVDGADIVEVTCSPSVTTYGRYVYILHDMDDEPFSLCEVEVYGDEIPIDMEPKVEFTSPASDNTFSVTEGTPQAALTLTRSGSGNTCTYVDYHTSDTGGFTVIPSTKPSTVSWLGPDLVAANAEKTINIDITQDNLCQPPETFNVYLTDVVGANLGTLCYTTVNIADDDSMTFSLSPPTSPISEGSTVPLSITVNRAGPGFMQVASAELRFAGGNATSDDYDDGDQTLQFSSSTSADSQTASVDIIDDACYEGNKWFTVSLGSLSPETCSITAVPISANVIIEEDDSLFYWEIGTVSIKEGDPPATVNIRRMGDEQDKDVEYNIVPAVGITEQELLQEVAITPSDRVSFGSSVSSRQVTIAVTDDYSVENTESFTLELEDPNGDNCPGGNLGATPRLVVQISDNDAEYEWKDTSFLVTEGAGSVRVCLRRTGDTTTNQAVDIAYSTTSSARSGFDFTPLTRISFSGTPEACMDVPIISDGTPEGTETFTLTVDPANSVQIGSDNVLTVTITDDDAIISWVESTYTVSENRNVAVAIEKEGNVAVSVRVSANGGTATPGLDFTPVSTVFTIPASQSTYEFQIDIVDDDEDDNDETFSVTLSSGGSSLGTVTIVSPAVTTIRITDDDPTPTVPPVDDDGLSGGAIAGIVVAAVIGALVIIGAVVFLLFMAGGGAGAGAAAAGAAGVGGAGGAAGAYGGQQGMQLANYGYPDANAYGLQNFSFGNGYGNNTGFNNFGGNRQFGY